MKSWWKFGHWSDVLHDEFLASGKFLHLAGIWGLGNRSSILKGIKTKI